MDSVGLHDGYVSLSLSLCAVHSTATRVSCCRLRPPTLGLHPPSTRANMTGPSTASQPNVRGQPRNRIRCLLLLLLLPLAKRPGRF